MRLSSSARQSVLAGISHHHRNNTRSSHPVWAATTRHSPDNRSRTGTHRLASDPSTDDHIQGMSMLSMIQTIIEFHFLGMSVRFGSLPAVE